MQTFNILGGKIGGAEKFTLRLITEMIKNGLNPVMITSIAGRIKPEFGTYKYNENTIAIIYLPRPNIRFLGSFIQLIYLIVWFSTTLYQAKVIQVSSIKSVSTIVILLSKLFGKIIVCRTVGGDFHQYRNIKNPKEIPYFMRIKIPVINLVDHVIAQSNYSKRILELMGIDSSKITVIRNGVSLSNYKKNLAHKSLLRKKLGLEDDVVYVCCVNNLVSIKRVDIIISAISYLNNAKVKLIIIGDGVLRTHLEKLTFDLGITDKVIFAGIVNPPVEYLQSSDIFVLVSEVENYSNALIEAMACGLPIIASGVGGNKEIIQDGHNGFLLSANPSSSEVADAISLILENEPLVESFSKNARKSAEENNSIQMIGKKYMDLFMT